MHSFCWISQQRPCLSLKETERNIHSTISLSNNNHSLYSNTTILSLSLSLVTLKTLFIFSSCFTLLLWISFQVMLFIVSSVKIYINFTTFLMKWWNGFSYSDEIWWPSKNSIFCLYPYLVFETMKFQFSLSLFYLVCELQKYKE